MFSSAVHACNDVPLSSKAGLLALAITERPDSSVVERGPEKAGVGGSIPSLATTLFNYFRQTT
jgi:hypothetical protein